MIGVQVVDTDGAIAAIRAGTLDHAAYDRFIERYLSACDGDASARLVEQFLPSAATGAGRG
jgi:hypothetical protein